MAGRAGRARDATTLRLRHGRRAGAGRHFAGRTQWLADCQTGRIGALRRVGRAKFAALKCMNRSLVIVLGALALGAAVFAGSYFASQRACVATMTRSADDLSWLREEFHLNDAEM